jgi:hypothetical protein
LNAFLKSAIDSGVVDEAIGRVTRSFKRQRTSNGSGSDEPSMVTADPNAISPEQDEAQEDVERIEPSVSLPVAPERPSELPSSRTTFPPELLPGSSAFDTSNWMPELDSDFDGASSWRFDPNSLSQYVPTATQSTEQSSDDWFLLPSDTQATYHVANGQDQESSARAKRSRNTKSSATL